MAIYLVGTAALAVWRMASLELCQRPRPRPCPKTSTGDSHGSIRELRAQLERTGMHGLHLHRGDGAASACAPTLEILVDDPKKSHRVNGLRCRIHEGALLPGSLCRIPNAEIYVASPELCFLQACNGPSLLPKVELGLELCGHYVRSDLINPAAAGPDGPGGAPTRPDAGCEGRPPLTSTRRLRAYLIGAHELHGVRPSRRALRWVLDGARSPRESALHLALDLPARLGGYGLGTPVLNYPICVGAADAPAPAIAREGEVCFGDLAYVREGVVAEYDGFASHGGQRLDTGEDVFDARKVCDDKDRWSRIQAAGWKMVVFFRRDMASHQRFARKAHQLASCLGKSIGDESAEAWRRRVELQRWLFNPRRTQV